MMMMTFSFIPIWGITQIKIVTEFIMVPVVFLCLILVGFIRTQEKGSIRAE
jgi:fucose 4-O-acetylase-like acetyltransferase